MSLHLFIPSINEILALLIKSHASSGGTVLLSRAGKVWNNPSTKSIINAWHPKDVAGKLLQNSFLELCDGGDGGKMAVFMACSLIKSFYRLSVSEDYQEKSVKKSLFSVLDQIEGLPSNEDVLIKVGLQSGLDIEDVKSVAQSISLSGSSSSHISLEKWEGVGCEVIQTDSFLANLKIHSDKEVYLKGAMFVLFQKPLFEVKEIVPVMEFMSSFEGRPLVVIAPMVGGGALKTINLNRNKGVLEAYACDAPRVTWSEGWLEDMASFTGATVYNTSFDSEFKPVFFGSALEVVLNYNEMVVTPYDEHAERTSDRADFLLKEADLSPFPHTQDTLRKRANALNGTLVRLKVGGVTESESRWRRVLIEKALISMSDVNRSGYVKGSIPCLYNIETNNPILERALKSPFNVVCHNLGKAVNDKTVWESPLLYELFPASRLSNLITKAVSVATTIGSVSHIVEKEKR